MLIDLKKTKYYYLTTRTNAKRVKHIEDILKDDVSLSETIPDNIEIPDDADIIYIGVSCGVEF
jgi:hypothetical protein